jgi:catalase-peroxidase
MLTTDLSLKLDPAYEEISRRFFENPISSRTPFARAWFKLTHRDMGPIARYLRPARAEGDADLAGSGSPRGSSADRGAGHCRSEGENLASGLSVSQLVSAAWASASTFRGSDKRGGANGARIRLAPQKDWRSTSRPSSRCPAEARAIQKEFGKKVSLADLIVLGRLRRDRKSREGGRARREGPLHAGTHGRVAGADRRSLLRARSNRAPTASATMSAEAAVHVARGSIGGSGAIADADGPEMTVLVGGLRVLGATPDSPNTASSPKARDADERLLRQPARHEHAMAARRLRWRVRGPRQQDESGRVDRHPRRPDLRFALQLRALAEVYGCADSKEKFVKDFVAAWSKVMNLDRFDLA